MGRRACGRAQPGCPLFTSARHAAQMSVEPGGSLPTTDLDLTVVLRHEETRTGPLLGSPSVLCLDLHQSEQRGFPDGSSVMNLPALRETWGSIPGSGTSPGGGDGNPTPVFLPGEFHGQRSLAGCRPWGRKCDD